MNILKRSAINLEGLLLRFLKKKRLIFVAKNELMFFHVIDLIKALRDDERISCRVCFCTPEQFLQVSPDELIHRYRLISIPYSIARYLYWDLVIYPDHTPWFRHDCRKIYINHGIVTGIRKNGTFYEFSEPAFFADKLVYDKVFVSSEYLCRELAQDFPFAAGKLKNVGNLLADRILGYGDASEYDHKNLHLDMNRKTILVTSTWGKEALINLQGKELFKQIRHLNRHYNVILSLHPHCYRDGQAGGSSLAEQIEICKREGVFCIAPNDLSIMKIAREVDVLIGDKSSFSLYFLLLNKPMLLFDTPGIDLARVSLMRRLREVCPLFDKAELLDKAYIDDVIEHFKPETYSRLSQLVCNHRGQALNRHLEEIYDNLGLTPLNHDKEMRRQAAKVFD